IGFIFGYTVASIIYAIMAADHVKHAPSMVLEDPAVSFPKVHPPGDDGVFTHGYFDYIKHVDRLKLVFNVVGFLVIVLLMLVTLALKWYV
ncbi:MAG: hypothetical protein P8J32_07665, partial [bacterium]|nr:hypothetical protein [bacterium]